MKNIYTLLLLLLFLIPPDIYTQDKSIIIYDPFGVSSSFQSSFSILSDDSVFITNTIDESIYNSDALFLFLGYPYELNQDEGNRLINYLQNKMPIYLYTELGLANTDSVNFWNYIGLEFYTSLTVVAPVDSVIGVDSEFTNGVSIDTSFLSPDVPAPQGNLKSILRGAGDSFGIDVAYISGYDSVKIIVDQYFQIHHFEFLDDVLLYFGLNDPNSISEYNVGMMSEFYLSQNYPNPFNPVTSIQYAAGSRQFVQLRIYDVLGNEIATLVNVEKSAGSYEAEFDGKDLSSGIYFYKLQTANYISTMKMVYLK